MDFPGNSDSKASAYNAGDTGDTGLIPRLGRYLEKEIATHSSILAWRIPRTEKSLVGWSLWGRSVRHNWATFAHLLARVHTLPDSPWVRTASQGSCQWEESRGLAGLVHACCSCSSLQCQAQHLCTCPATAILNRSVGQSFCTWPAMLRYGGSHFAGRTLVWSARCEALAHGSLWANDTRLSTTEKNERG